MAETDLIRRSDAIDAIFSEPLYEPGMKKRDADAVVLAIYEKIKSLPSLQPEPINVNVDHAMTEEELKALKQKFANLPVVLLPSAQPEQKRGKWIDAWRSGMDGTRHWHRECSECGYERDDDNIDKDTNFCPNCGARMDEPQESEDKE